MATLAALVLLTAVARPGGAQEVEARLDRTRISVGEATALRVTVRGGSGAREPIFDLPEGLRRMESGRQQSFSWVNGRASSETEFRFEILAESAGRYAIGPILVTLGSRSFKSGQLQLEVSNAPPPGEGSGGSASEEPATLRVDVEPQNPYLGQEVTLRVRLFQRVSFAEDPQYAPPATTGFWSDRPSAPESYYAQERGGRVLVTETRTRLYPLAVGEATIGEAAASVIVAGAGGDPMGLLGPPGREQVLRSRPVPVRVRPLPGGAPEGFTGAVGGFELTWGADRARTSRDVPVTVRLDVRGRGNLPLARAPAFAASDFEVFASTVEDSLGPPGSSGPGRKRYQWTLLPRREGRLAVPPPAFAWFDPRGESYHLAEPPPLVLEVGVPLFAGAGDEAGFPRVFQDRRADPAGRSAQPWGFALAGALLGLAARVWRRAGRPSASRTTVFEVAEVTAMAERLRLARGEEFWKLAEEAVRWLQGNGKVADSPPWREARSKVSAARYGGAAGDEALVRRVVAEHLGAAMPRPGARTPWRLVGAALALAALALAAASGPWPGAARAARGALAADQAAKRGETERARRAWAELWQQGGHDARLAARVAWADAQAGEIGPAALWVARGEIADPREGSLRWVEGRVREAGGLMGSSPARLPVRPLEWSLAALLAGAASVLLGRRRLGPVLAAVAIACGSIYPLQGLWATRSGRAVVLQSATLGSGVELDAGQMVTVVESRGDRVRIEAGRVLGGWVPAAAIERVVPSGGARD